MLILAELVVDVRLPDFSGQQTGCEPNFDLRPPGVRGFRGAEHRTHFCGGRIPSATQWVAFFGSRGKIRPATHFRGGGIPSATHRRSKSAIRAATHPAVARTRGVGRGSNPLGRVSKTLLENTKCVEIQAQESHLITIR